jgi:xylan 1,4-beta-xylosidase
LPLLASRSYNALNGVPTCANDFLLTQVLRGAWDADAYVTSDCGAVSDVRFTHNYTANASATARVTLRAGMDIGCDDFLVAAGVIPAALADGSITQDDVDTAVRRQLRVRMRTGEFDPRGIQPYAAIPPSVVCSPAHVELARDGARQGITLAHNPAGVLPLSRAGLARLAVVGPLANNSYINGGPNYNGVPCQGSASTVLSALVAGSGGAAVTFAPGCADVACDSTGGFAAAAAAAAAADATVVVVGIDATLEDEGLDRVDIGLPGQQGALVSAVCAAAAGKPCVLVVVSGGAVDVSPVLGAVSAVFVAGLPGAVGADALVDLLFGDAVPAGRLTQTHYPASFVDAVSLFEMGLRPGPSAWPPFMSPGRTHQWYTGPVVWPFGWGLSYTTFNVSAPAGPTALSLADGGEAAYLAPAAAATGHGAAYAPSLSSPLVATYAVNVTNTGARAADYVALGFLVPPGAGTGGVPLETLFGFARVHVPAGATVTAWLGLRAHALTRVVEGGDELPDAHPLAPRVRRVGVPGDYVVRVGVKAPGQEWAEARLRVE